MSNTDNPYSGAISPETPSSTVDAATLDGASLSEDGTLVNDSDLLIPTEKAVKTYVDSNTEKLDAITVDGDENITTSADLNVAEDLAVAGNAEITGNVTVTGSAAISSTATAETLALSIADGTTPMSITSTTKVSNLNVDQVDGADIDTDNTLAADSDVRIATQKAIKAYVDSLVSSAAVAIGDILMSPLETKSGYLLCDGSAVSRSTYSDLFDEITSDKGAVTITEANPAVVTLTGHGFATGERIELTTDGTLPTNLAEYTNYYVYYVDANTFQLATTLANAIAGTTINSTGSIQSGTHSLRFVPFGVSTSANFLVPDFQAVVPKGKGDQTINTRSKTGPTGVGVLDEDATQSHRHNDGEASNQNGPTGSIPSVVWFSSSTDTTAPIVDGSYGTPRIGSHTKDSSIGINFFMRYQ